MQSVVRKTITKSLLFNLELANTGKKEFLSKLWNAYKKVMEYFIDLAVKKNRMPDYQDVKTCPVETFLSARYKNQALQQVKSILKGYFKAKRKLEKKGKAIGAPVIKKISMKLSDKFFSFEKGQNSFDFWLKLRDPEREEWIAFPVKNYEYAKEYFENWRIRPFIEILQKDGKWYLKLIFTKTVELREERLKGVDIGYRKLIATSDGEIYGEHIKEIIEKEIDRKKQGSKNWGQKKQYLKTEINRTIKKVIDGTFSPVLEALKNLKKKKSGKWTKGVNKKFNHWIYGYVMKRIKELCETAGVQHYIVPPAYTSRTCPECSYQDKLNRNGELFKCLGCGCVEDADVVGARNILRRFIEELRVPLPAKPILIVE